MDSDKVLMSAVIGVGAACLGAFVFWPNNKSSRLRQSKNNFFFQF